MTFPNCVYVALELLYSKLCMPLSSRVNVHWSVIGHREKLGIGQRQGSFFCAHYASEKAWRLSFSESVIADRNESVNRGSWPAPIML